MGEWEINKTQGCCYATNKEFEYDEEYFAALVETDDGLQRRDFCAEYWENEKPKVFCYWKTRLPSPDQKKQIFVDDEMLMVFFERLAQETDEEKINFRFVLMLVLMRKRRLKYESSKTQNGKEVWRLRIAGTKDVVEVVNPHLADDQMEELSSQIGQILQVDL
jgi:hypothetical protein